MERLKLAFANVVWGEKFTGAFLSACLPSQLSANNLPAVASVADCSYRIYTATRDVPAIVGSPAYKKLASLMPVEIAELSGHLLASRYDAASQCYSHLIRSHRSEDLGFVLMTPDWVWSDGAVKRLWQLARDGKRLVAVNTPRVVSETFLPEYQRQFGSRGHVAGPRELVKLALDHLHPITQMQVWETTGPRSCSGELWWQIGTEGLLARQFHLHPILVRPVNREATPQRTVDSDYIANTGVAADEIHVVQDSDDVCVMDFTSGATRIDGAPPRNDVDELVKWARSSTSDLHRRFVQYSIRYHWQDDLGPAWHPAEREANAVVRQVLERLEDGVAPVAAPSRTRFIDPRFWIAKFRVLGPRQVVQVAWARALSLVGRLTNREGITIKLPVRSQ